MIKDATQKQVKIMYFDTETVTLESPENSCAFFQLSGMIEIDGEEVERFDFLMNPEHSCEYDPESLAFNEIDEAYLETLPSHKEVFKEFVALIEKHVNKFDKNDKIHSVGFNNIGFDNPKLWNWFSMMDELRRQEIEEEYRQKQLKYDQTGLDEDKPGRMPKVYNMYGSLFWSSPVIDTFPILGVIFIRYRNLFKNFKLQTVAEKLSQMGLLDEKYQKSDNWHDAMFDIEATRDLFHFCLRMCGLNIFDVPVVPKVQMTDEEIAVKMLSRFKELHRQMPDKAPDVEMMLGLLDVVRNCM